VNLSVDQDGIPEQFIDPAFHFKRRVVMLSGKRGIPGIAECRLAAEREKGPAFDIGKLYMEKPHRGTVHGEDGFSVCDNEPVLHIFRDGKIFFAAPADVRHLFPDRFILFVNTADQRTNLTVNIVAHRLIQVEGIDGSDDFSGHLPRDEKCCRKQHCREEKNPEELIEKKLKNGIDRAGYPQHFSAVQPHGIIIGCFVDGHGMAGGFAGAVFQRFLHLGAGSVVLEGRGILCIGVEKNGTVGVDQRDAAVGGASDFFRQITFAGVIDGTGNEGSFISHFRAHCRVKREITGAG